MLSIPRRCCLLLFNLALFALLWTIYLPHQAAWRQAPDWGNASPVVRQAVLDRLARFQSGYSQRHPQQAKPFVEDLFSGERPMVLGTMPGEIFVGQTAVADLVRSDWERWGDCRFRLAETQVSAAGEVAWFATVGSVRFDLSRLLVLPLRLTGVMVAEAGIWKIRQLQFQFDLDCSALLLVDVLLLGWLLVNVILLGLAIRARARKDHRIITLCWRKNSKQRHPSHARI